jgi:methyl-accepting chemotaxis protein
MGSALPSKKPRDPTIHQKIEQIKTEIDRLISKIHKQSAYNPTRSEVEKYAVQINEVIMKNRESVRQFESFLKAAIIDLTEVPEMHPQMQRISFITALKDASQKLQLFLDCC